MNYVRDISDIPIESNKNDRPIALFIVLVTVFTLAVVFLTFNTFSFQSPFLCEYYGTIIFAFPCVAGLVVSKVYHDRVAPLSLGACKARYIIAGVMLAVLYLGASYTTYWMIAPGSFAPVLTGAMMAYIPLQLLTAFGQEAGVRGCLMPVMVNRFGFVKAALLIGILEALWQILIVSPSIFSASYYPGAWGICMMSIVAFSVILSYLRLKSGSIWPCVALSGANTFLLYVFRSSTASAEQVYFVGETGIFSLAILTLIACITLFQFRNEQGSKAEESLLEQ